MPDASRREPIFNIPSIIVFWLAVLILLHVGRSLLTEESDDWFVLALAFIPNRYAHDHLNWPGGLLSAWLSPLTHMLLHGDGTHLMLNAASLAAFGTICARRLGAIRFMALAIASGLAGCALFYIFNANLVAPLIGASGAIAGLMAVALQLLFSAIDTNSGPSIRDLVAKTPERIAVKPLPKLIADPRMQVATTMWLLINLLAAFGLGTPGAVGTIAWEAHIGGFFAGLLAFAALDRPKLNQEPPIEEGRSQSLNPD